MNPTSRIRVFIGICCIFCSFLLAWGTLVVLQDTYTLYNQYVGINRRITMFVISSVSGFLLFSTAGVALLTGGYQEHKRVYQLIWLSLGILAIVLFLWVWIDASIIQEATAG